jgi:hypothetical protein
MQVHCFTVHLIQIPSDLFDTVSHYAECVLILGSGEPIADSLELVRTLRSQAGIHGAQLERIFILADQATQAPGPGIEVIVPPFSLKQVATRIELFSKQLSFGHNS